MEEFLMIILAGAVGGFIFSLIVKSENKGIIIYAIIAYITCPRKENGSFEEGAIALYIIVPVVVLAIYFICNN